MEKQVTTKKIQIPIPVITQPRSHLSSYVAIDTTGIKMLKKKKWPCFLYMQYQFPTCRPAFPVEKEKPSCSWEQSWQKKNVHKNGKQELIFWLLRTIKHLYMSFFNSHLLMAETWNTAAAALRKLGLCKTTQVCFVCYHHLMCCCPFSSVETAEQFIVSNVSVSVEQKLVL